MPANANLADQADPMIGRVIAGRHRIIERIGSGSMGHVYRALHLTLQKDVAIKVMKTTKQDELRTTRFVREARTASRLDHRHTVQILDFGEDGDDGLLYLAMEYLEGEDLGQVLERELRLDHERIIDIMMQVLAAVGAAHDHGIIHRDLKPSNIFLTKRTNDDGDLIDFVKVCDFGVAKFIQSTKESLAGTIPGGEVVGTPLYMSPEQAVGDTLDARTDIYSAGLVMYEMITGRPPFMSETAMGVMLKHVQEAPVAPSKLVPNVDPDLESVVGWALVKDRNERCPSAREFRNALREVRTRSGTTRTASTSDPSIDLEKQLRSYVEAMGKPAAATQAAPSPQSLVADLDVGTPVPAPPNAQTADVASPAVDEVSIEALVAEAVDEVQATHEHTPLPASSIVEPLDARRPGSAAERQVYLWEHYGMSAEDYTGPYPFWVRDHREEVIGPISYEDTLKIVQTEATAGHAEHVSIRGESDQWLNAVPFAKLTGQEVLVDHQFSKRTKPKPGAFSGRLGKVSLTSLFARLARERPTGRIIFDLTTNDGETRMEIHLVNGAPTFVYSSEPRLQLPALLVRRDLLREGMLPRFLQMVIAEEKPLEEIVGREANLDMTQYRTIFMRERLCFMFKWQKGTYWLDSETLPARMTPFSTSLMAVLPDVVYRAMSAGNLQHAIRKYLDLPIERSQRFTNGVAAMQLSTAQKSVVRRYLKSSTLREAIPTEPKLEKLYYAMAYILLETELFLKPIGAR